MLRNQATPTLENIFGAFGVEANSEFYVSAKMRIAKIYFGTGKFELAIERAFALPKGFGIGETSLDCARINALCLIGESFLAQRNFTEARRFLTPCSSLRKRIGILKPTSIKRQNFLKFAMMSMRFKF